MNKTEILDELWSLPIEEIDWINAGLERIRSLKAELHESVNSSEQGNLAEASENRIVSADPPPLTQRTVAATARDPLRPPKPGSLRETVHGILRGAGKPLRRAEIIRVVAKIKGLEIDDKLKTKVGEILRCSLDQNIKKIAYGIYRFAE